MLALTRKRGEEVVITTPEGREIVVALVRIDRGHARLGFVADRDVTILRREVPKRKTKAA